MTGGSHVAVISVLGEVTLDTITADTQYTRPGGIVYSALAGRSVGMQTALVGYIGVEGGAWVRALLDSRGIDHSQLREKERPTTRFVLANADEIEPTIGSRLESGVPPSDLPPLPSPETKGLLLYPYPLQHMLAALDACPGATVCYDLQYDLQSHADLEVVARRCHIVFASRAQAMEYFKASTVDDLAARIRAYGPRIVVIKSGLCGSTAYTDDGVYEIPRYESDWSQSVGAGDVYNAVFLAEWLRSGDVSAAGHSAAAAAARFCEGNGSDLMKDWDLGLERNERTTFYLHPDKLSSRLVYLAGPFFDFPQTNMINRLRRLLEHHGIRVFSPKDVDGKVDLDNALQCSQVYVNNLRAIEEAAAVVAVLDGSDPGTLFEVGYATKKGVPVIGLWTGPRKQLNLMPYIGTQVVSGFRSLVLELLASLRNHL